MDVYFTIPESKEDTPAQEARTLAAACDKPPQV
jgi:hypothetical protein